jgi:putative endonuclease
MTGAQPAGSMTKVHQAVNVRAVNRGWRIEGASSHSARKRRGFARACPLPLGPVVPEGKRFVYILKSLADPARSYIGVTADLHHRLGAHNAGECVHTARYRPWTLDVVIAFSDEPRALAFERYLKSGSGTAFSDRHLR